MFIQDPDNLSSTSSSTIQTITENDKETSLIYSIPMTLLQVISQNYSIPLIKTQLKSQKKNKFTSKTLPKISLSDYLNRIWKYSKIDESTLILSLIYIDRLCAKTKLALTDFNVHRLILTSFLIAVKYNEDKFFSNVFYAKLGGMNVNELNNLEEKFIVCICFDLFVDSEEYQQYKQTLELNILKNGK